CLHHRGGIDIQLDRGLPPAENIALKIRRDADHECIPSAIHQRDDVAFGDRPRRLEIGKQKACAMRRDSSERSSSTMAIDALCTSCELLCACAIMASENA